jgi:hypothetical protein
MSEAARLLGKRSWIVRVERFGIERLKQNAARMGRQSKGRPRLPDDRVTLGALYQRARRERLKERLQAKSREDERNDEQSQ